MSDFTLGKVKCLVELVSQNPDQYGAVIGFDDSKSDVPKMNNDLQKEARIFDDKSNTIQTFVLGGEFHREAPGQFDGEIIKEQIDDALRAMKESTSTITVKIEEMPEQHTDSDYEMSSSGSFMSATDDEQDKPLESPGRGSFFGGSMEEQEQQDPEEKKDLGKGSSGGS